MQGSPDIVNRLLDVAFEAWEPLLKYEQMVFRKTVYLKHVLQNVTVEKANVSRVVAAAALQRGLVMVWRETCHKATAADANRALECRNSANYDALQHKLNSWLGGRQLQQYLGHPVRLRPPGSDY